MRSIAATLAQSRRPVRVNDLDGERFLLLDDGRAKEIVPSLAWPPFNLVLSLRHSARR